MDKNTNTPDTENEQEAETTKKVKVTFSIPDEWTIEHYGCYARAKQMSGDEGNIGSYVGSVALIKRGFVKVVCDDDEVKAKVMKWLDADEQERLTLSTKFMGFITRNISAPLIASMYEDPNF